ncbi:MAG: hypothetical protein [Caudoviricetes sp.]|nr:MAG: hypothetical protein [Caudoviricetes sp.]
MLYWLLVKSVVVAEEKNVDISFDECILHSSKRIEENVMSGIYKVGGCVRDAYMGIEPHDIDYVVVGSSEREMIKAGFDKVGAGFPVFIHPQTHDEYALARTEKKTGTGYLGFETYFGPEVTLEQDLHRRDFTMNAMAERHGEICDPYNGRSDIDNKIIRHVNPDAFAEDPVRILRAARFAARYDFEISYETMELISKVEITDIEAVPVERVMRELEKALDDGKGYEFLKIISAMPEIIFDLFFFVNFDSNFVHIDQVYRELGMEGVVCLIAEFGGDSQYLARVKASSDTIFLSRLITLSGQRHAFDPDDAYELIQRSDFYRRPEFLVKLEKYMAATTLNLITVANLMAKVKASDLDPSLKGIQIKHALCEKRRKVFDDYVGL